jgi:predicted transglutaminase-like cysteine proteinase
MDFKHVVGTTILGAAIMLAPSFSLQANSKQTTVDKVAMLEIFGSSLPPVGYVQFCSRGEDECLQKGGKSQRIAMSPENWNMFNQVNSYVNSKIQPESDIDLYKTAEMWAYPTTSGDCEDYVLLKKRYLQSIGFAADQLLITVLLDEKGDGHAVLTVTTDGGDFILDNRRDDILRWDQTAYQFLKRQSQADPKKWVSLKKSASLLQVTSKSN